MKPGPCLVYERFPAQHKSSQKNLKIRGSQNQFKFKFKADRTIFYLKKQKFVIEFFLVGMVR